MDSTSYSHLSLGCLVPLAALMLNLLIGKRLGEKGISWIAVLGCFIPFVISVLLWIALKNQRVPWWSPGRMITIGTLNLSWTFRVDSLAVT